MPGATMAIMTMAIGVSDCTHRLSRLSGIEESRTLSPAQKGRQGVQQALVGVRSELFRESFLAC